MLNASEQAAFENPKPAGVDYLDEPKVDYPVLPFQIFGLYYDLDLVMVTQDTGWDMHEYARIQTPDGPIWMAKDSKPDGVQTIVSDVDDLLALVAEVPVPRISGRIHVEDNSKDNQVDVRLTYTNPEGVTTEVEYQGKTTQETTSAAKRFHDGPQPTGGRRRARSGTFRYPK